MKYPAILALAVPLISGCSAKSAASTPAFAAQEQSVSAQTAGAVFSNSSEIFSAEIFSNEIFSAETLSAEIFSNENFSKSESLSTELFSDGNISADVKENALGKTQTGYDQPQPKSPQTGAGETEKTRKLIRKAQLRLQTQNPETAETAAAEAMRKYGAYAAETRIYEHSRSYSIKVPEKAFQSLLEALTQIGRILYRSESAEDATIKYYDLAGRLETKLTLRKTFQGYLETAKSIEDIMRVESRLAELHNEIDWMGTELRALANLADYGTIDLEIQSPRPAGASDAPALRERIRVLFASFGYYAATALLILIGILVYGAPSLLILFLLYWLLLGKVGILKTVWRIASGKGKEKP
ncbi:MAG: DUF4349 domain-containing protein [Spirochaetaceae bacterium]|jgi:hypothetical protein|nr:DUF4349 domain-containing protein [Spirochaetaceae bacterium]